MNNFNNDFGKEKCNDILKVTKNKASHSLQTVCFLKYTSCNMDLFLNETSILVFAELAIFHSI